MRVAHTVLVAELCLLGMSSRATGRGSFTRSVAPALRTLSLKNVLPMSHGLDLSIDDV